MKRNKLAVVCASVFLSLGAALPAAAQVTVGGAAMYQSNDIIDNAVNSKDHGGSESCRPGRYP